MTATANRRPRDQISDETTCKQCTEKWRGYMMAMAKRVMTGGAVAGVVGGAAMIGLMIIVMGAMGSGYATH